jgi:predicted dithiol-disulfide oxidoreductase (DUF899 family)
MSSKDRKKGDSRQTSKEGSSVHQKFSWWEPTGYIAAQGSASTAGKHRALPETHGLDRAVVLFFRQRFQRRLRCHADSGETFGLSVFLRDGDSVFRTYFTAGRGVEALGSTWTLLDLTPLGRQEDWEDSPGG